MPSQTNKREFCPECRVVVDDERRCKICNHCLIDVDFDNEEIADLVALGLLTQYDTGEYNLTLEGVKAIQKYAESIVKDLNEEPS